MSIKSYLESNENLSENQKKLLEEQLDFIASVYELYGAEYNFGNISYLIKTLKLKEGSLEDDISYDKDSNVIILGKSNNNREYNSYKSLFSLTSRSYNEELNRYTNGLIINIDGEEYGSKLNDLLVDKMIIYVRPSLVKDDDKELTKINVHDRVIYDITRLFSLEFVVTCFAEGNGKLLFDKIVEFIGLENAQKFYSSIDRYEDNPLLNQRIYDLCRESILMKQMNKVENEDLKM